MRAAGVEVLRCGAGCGALLGHACGRVAAIFERSFYIESHGEFVCVGPRRIGNGPLNAIVGAEDFELLRQAVTLGGTYAVAGDCSARFGKLSLHFSAASRWEPPVVSPPSLDWSLSDIARVKTELDSLLPEDGLAKIILRLDAAEGSPLASVARPAISSLRSVLRAGATGHEWPRETLTSAARLLGLGPGLTPSGDDVIGGVLIALRAAKRRLLAERLWSALLPLAIAGTSPLSLAHLRAAAAGQGAEALHRAMNDLFSRSFDSLSVSIRDLGKVGHTSGFDGLAGVILALESWNAPGAP
ncbi:MAG: DUF2877 domain-containing protein [Hyphomicrobiaceae bacterium]|nr:MAG: DUF2877 domain-containing protein [Hyphomicrobiaceae bacterium]